MHMISLFCSGCSYTAVTQFYRVPAILLLQLNGINKTSHPAYLYSVQATLFRGFTVRSVIFILIFALHKLQFVGSSHCLNLSYYPNSTQGF